MQIRLAGIVPESIVDGPGMRYVIFTQGCPHHCEGCHNPATHDFSGGYLENTQNIIDQILKNPLLQGVTLSGGEPMMQPQPLIEIVQAIKQHGKDVVVYSGFTYERILADGGDKAKLLKLCDYLIDGKFIFNQRSLSLQFRGSLNQRIIDIQASLQQGQIVEKSF